MVHEWLNFTEGPVGGRQKIGGDAEVHQPLFRGFQPSKFIAKSAGSASLGKLPTCWPRATISMTWLSSSCRSEHKPPWPKHCNISKTSPHVQAGSRLEAQVAPACCKMLAHKASIGPLPWPQNINYVARPNVIFTESSSCAADSLSERSPMRSPQDFSTGDISCGLMLSQISS